MVLEFHRVDFLDVLRLFPHPVLIKDADGVYRFVNEAAARMFGEAANDIIGKTDSQFFEDQHPLKARHFSLTDGYVIETGKSIHISEYIGQLRGPEGALYLTAKQRIKDIGGSSCVLVVCTNMTMAHKRYNKASQDAENLEWVITDHKERLDRMDLSSSADAKVFISYKHGDKTHEQWVQDLFTALKDFHHITCVLDKNDLTAGDSLPEFVNRIDDGSHAILVINEEALNAVRAGKGWLAKEWSIAKQGWSSGNLKLVPVLRTVDDIPIEFKDLVYLDFRNDEAFHSQVFDLAEAVRRVRPTP